MAIDPLFPVPPHVIGVFCVVENGVGGDMSVGQCVVTLLLYVVSCMYTLGRHFGFLKSGYRVRERGAARPWPGQVRVPC